MFGLGSRQLKEGANSDGSMGDPHILLGRVYREHYSKC